MPKRKRPSDGDAASHRAASASRPRVRGDGYSTRSSFQLSSPTGSAVSERQPAGLSGPGLVQVPTYPDYRQRPDGGPSGHSYAQDRRPELDLRHGNDTMSIARPRPEARMPEVPYSPHAEYAPPDSPDNIQLSCYDPESSSPTVIHNQVVYNLWPRSPYTHHYHPVPQQYNVLLSQLDSHAHIEDFAAQQPPFQGPSFGLSQPQPSSEDVGPLQQLQLLQHQQPTLHPPPPPPPPNRHHQGQKPFLSHQLGTQQPQGRAAPFRPLHPESNVPYPTYTDPQFKQASSADTKALSHYPISNPTPTVNMGGGPIYPNNNDSLGQVPGDGYPAQHPIGQPPIVSNPTGSAISSTYTGSEKMADGAIRAQGSLSYEMQTAIAEGADWQQPVDFSMERNHKEESSDGFGNHGLSNDSGVSDEMDTDGDVDAPGDSSRMSVEQEEAGLKQEEAASSSLLRSKRNPLSPTHRKQTAETRKIKACTRCRMQKMRCETDVADPTGDCVGCKNFSKTSKKTIHRLPCYRGKITDAVLFRSGGLELTKRWKGTEMKDIAERINPTDIKTIEFTLGICTEPIQVEVVQFQTQFGDITARFWTVPDGEHNVRKKKDLAPYCLASIQKTAAYFEEYIKKHAVEVMRSERAGGRFAPRDIIEKTYAMAIRRYEDFVNKPWKTEAEEKEMKFLENLFILWFAMRHSTGSSWICGRELLGMKPETKDDTYPLYKRVSVPRMILAQFDSIIHTKLLTKYGKLVLTELENMLSRSVSPMWFAAYLCLFILLREASWISQDRYRHARSNYGKRIRYSIPAFVESLQESCNNLLQHWHYFNPGAWPDPSRPEERHKSHLDMLGPSEYELVMMAYTDTAVQRQLNVWRLFKANNGVVETPAPSEVGGRAYEGRQVRYDWDHPYYWISQLFEEEWLPHPTYQRECLN